MRLNIKVLKLVPTLVITLMGILMFSATSFAADSISSAANQTFAKNQATTAISTITVTNTDGDMTSANDIRIRIPADTDMTWDSSDTTFTCTDSTNTPCGDGDISTTVSYENSDKTLVINVTTNLDAGDAFTVSGLSFTSFTDASASDNLDLCVDGDCSAVEATDDKTIVLGAPTIVSSASQSYRVGDTPAPALDWTITITTSATAAIMDATNDIQIVIPTGVNLTFDPTDTSVIIAGDDYDNIDGCAASGCTTTVTFAQVDGTTACTKDGKDCRTMRIPIASGEVAASENFTVTGATFNLVEGDASSADSLEIEIAAAANWGTSATDDDSETITITTSAEGGTSTNLNPPSSIAATVNADNQVELTWNDASSTSVVRIYRGVSPIPVDASAAIAEVEAGVKTYTDTDVEVGDEVTYVLRTFGSNGNSSGVSSEVTITVEAGSSASSSDSDEDSEDESEDTEATDNTESETTETGDEEPAETTEDADTSEDDPMTYEEEKSAVRSAGVITKEEDKVANKCEAVAMILRAKQVDVDMSVTEDGKSDTPAWCKPYVVAAKAAGIADGESETVFGGLDANGVNRYAVVVMLARASGATEADLAAYAEQDSPYTDEVVDWAKGAVVWAYENKVMTGYPDGTFGGDKGILKIELAVASWRAYN